MIKPLVLTLLLLPGAMGSVNLSAPLEQALQKVCPNTHMVHYQPRTVLGETSFFDYEDQVRTEIQKHDAVVLVGHSMGGLLAARLINEPQVRGAVLLNPSPAANQRGAMDFKQTLKFLPHLPKFIYAYKYQKPLLYPPSLNRKVLFNGFDDQQAQHYIAQMQPESGTVVGQMVLSKTIVAPDTQKPVLCLFGAQDFNTNAAARQKMTDFYHTQPKLYPGDHFFFLTHEAEVAQDIADWIHAHTPVAALR